VFCQTHHEAHTRPNLFSLLFFFYLQTCVNCSCVLATKTRELKYREGDLKTTYLFAVLERRSAGAGWSSSSILFLFLLLFFLLLLFSQERLLSSLLFSATQWRGGLVGHTCVMDQKGHKFLSDRWIALKYLP